jgi:hypothetical protein
VSSRDRRRRTSASGGKQAVVFIMLLHAVGARVGVVASTAPDQRAALVDLYMSTNGSGWIDKTGWQDHVAGSDPCGDSWYGVECRGEGSVPGVMDV